MYNRITLSSKFDQEFETFFDSPEEAKCESCGGELSPEKVNLEEFEGGKLYLMEKVPAFVCQECGEVWIPEPFIKEFEKMLETAKKHILAKKKKKAPKKVLKKKPRKKKT